MTINQPTATPKSNAQMPWLRYAPVATNMAQFIGTLGRRPETVRAETIRPQMLTDRMNYTPTDSAHTINQIRQRFAGQDRALQSGSLGSSALANQYMMQSNRDRQAAEAEAMRVGEHENMNRRNQALVFNSQIAAQNAQADMQAQQINIQSRQRAEDINAANRAAADNQRSALLASAATDLGNIGREKFHVNTAKALGLGYEPDLMGNISFRRRAKGGKLHLPKIKSRK